jgi:hypothetical protein
MNRISRELWVGDVALDAIDRQHRRQRPAAAVLHHVAEAIDGGGLADHAEIDRLAGRGQFLDDLDRAVDGRSLFVRGDEQRDRSGCRRVIGDEASTAVTNAASDDFMSAAPRQAIRRAGRNKWIGFILRADPSARHRCAGKADDGRAVLRPKVCYAVRNQCFAMEASGASAAISDWQPASSGVTEGRAISRARARASNQLK